MAGVGVLLRVAIKPGIRALRVDLLPPKRCQGEIRHFEVGSRCRRAIASQLCCDRGIARRGQLVVPRPIRSVSDGSRQRSRRRLADEWLEPFPDGASRSGSLHSTGEGDVGKARCRMSSGAPEGPESLQSAASYSDIRPATSPAEQSARRM